MNGRELRASRRRIFAPAGEVDLSESHDDARDLRDAFRLDLSEATQEGLLVQGVAIHGAVSENGRRYSRKAMKSIATEADGMRAFADHPPSGRDEVRPVGALIGRVRNPRVVGDRIRADLQVVDSPPWRDLLPALSEDDFGIGFSIRARGTVRRGEDGGPDIVEDVTKLQAIELVSEPATTRGLRESIQEGRRKGGRPRFRKVTPEVLGRASWQLFS